jgi:hypothetical protein
MLDDRHVDRDRHRVCSLAEDPLVRSRAEAVLQEYYDAITLMAYRTKGDFAMQMQELVDVHFPEADVIKLVVDNLNTHTPAALYETFMPAEARRPPPARVPIQSARGISQSSDENTSTPWLKPSFFTWSCMQVKCRRYNRPIHV